MALPAACNCPQNTHAHMQQVGLYLDILGLLLAHCLVLPGSLRVGDGSSTLSSSLCVKGKTDPDQVHDDHDDLQAYTDGKPVSESDSLSLMTVIATLRWHAIHTYVPSTHVQLLASSVRPQTTKLPSLPFACALTQPATSAAADM